MHFNVPGLIRNIVYYVRYQNIKNVLMQNIAIGYLNTAILRFIQKSITTTSEEFVSETIQRWIICIQETLYQRPKERSKTKLIICKWMIILETFRYGNTFHILTAMK